MSNNLGKVFEEQFKKASEAVDGLFFYRIKDVNQMNLKPGAKVSKNLYDAFMYKYPNLIPVELKSVDANRTKSIGFQSSKEDKQNKHIKWHQIEALKKSVDTYGVIGGLILNFRFDDHEETYFIHIDDFLEYKRIAENKLKGVYESKTNEKSIPLSICKEIGMEIKSVKLKTKYSYHLKDFMKRLQEKYIN